MTMTKLGDFFRVERGDVKKITQLTESNAENSIRLISATHFDNGGNLFYIPTTETVYKSGLTINNNGSVGDVFFHNYSFTATADVTVIIPKDNHTITLLEGLYLKTTIEKQKIRFMYGYKISNDRLRDMLLNIPLNENGNISWKTMNDKMLSFISDAPTLPKTKNKLSTNNISLNDKKWKQFVVKDILTVDSGVRLTKENMVEGNIPFIGATSKNNGITNWVSNKNKSLDKNVLGVNYNGSVCDNFYHPYQAIFSDDVKRTHIKDKTVVANAYKYLFLKAVFLQCKAQYQYGYKFDGTRMKKQKIMLPVTKDDKPDWQFMEDYIKSLPNGDLI